MADIVADEQVGRLAARECSRGSRRPCREPRQAGCWNLRRPQAGMQIVQRRLGRDVSEHSGLRGRMERVLRGYLDLRALDGFPDLVAKRRPSFRRAWAQLMLIDARHDAASEGTHDRRGLQLAELDLCAVNQEVLTLVGHVPGEAVGSSAQLDRCADLDLPAEHQADVNGPEAARRVLRGRRLVLHVHIELAARAVVDRPARLGIGREGRRIGR